MWVRYFSIKINRGCDAIEAYGSFSLQHYLLFLQPGKKIIRTLCGIVFLLQWICFVLFLFNWQICLDSLNFSHVEVWQIVIYSFALGAVCSGQNHNFEPFKSMRTNKHFESFYLASPLSLYHSCTTCRRNRKTYTTFLAKHFIFLGSFLKTGFARYLTNPIPWQFMYKLEIKANKTTREQSSCGINWCKHKRIRGYLPTILFVALMLASSHSVETQTAKKYSSDWVFC